MAKRQGLRLNLPGAPLSPHAVPGVPGFFWPDVPTPVGGEGELDLKTARELSDDKGTHLELVEIAPSKVKEAEELAAQTLEAARKGIADARRDGPPFAASFLGDNKETE
jgi:hypothetical protein